LKATSQLDNTAIFLIIGDNGSSKEGGPNGSLASELNSPKKDDKGQVADLVKRYRPSARQGGPPDTGSSHIGFRTVARR